MLNNTLPKILMAQIEIVSGDIIGNTEKIIDVIHKNQSVKVFSSTFSDTAHASNYVADAKFVIFPELAISGYNNGALFEDDEFIQECLDAVNEIASYVNDEVVIVGCPRFGLPKYKKNGNLTLRNSAFVLHQGKIVGVYDKIHLANDFQHEDRKYFYPGKNTFTTTIDGLNFGVLICEDIWRNDHDRDLLAEMKEDNPGLEVVFCLNYSYFTYEKQNFRKNLLSGQAKDNQVAIAYVNAVGIGDIVKNIIAYDGASLIYNNQGELLGEMSAFKTDVQCYDLNAPAPIVLNTNWKKLPSSRDVKWAEKYLSIWQAEQYTLRKVWEASRLQKVFVAVSGGVDSAVVATLAAKTMGVENCVFVSMPSEYNGDVTMNAAQKLSDKLGVKLLWTPISESESAVLKTMDQSSTENPSENKLVVSTVDATLRSVIALGLCHQYKAGILSTGNHTENILGWCTFHDVGSIGVYQPIGDLTKTELFELCEFINWLYDTEIIPKGLWDGTIKPMAELADSSVDPFDYYLMSGICAELIRHRKTVNKLEQDFVNRTLTKDYFPVKLWVDGRNETWKTVYDMYTLEQFMDNVKEAHRRSKISVYKSAQHAPCLIISPRSRGFSSRETIFNAYE